MDLRNPWQDQMNVLAYWFCLHGYAYQPEELGENVLCQPPVIDPDNVITVLLFSQDIFTANGILKKVESFNGVKRVELFIITETTNYHEWVSREIDRRLIAKSTRAKQEVEPVYEVMSVGPA